MNKIDMTLIKSLVSLSPKTTREIANGIGMQQPNLMSALSRSRELPKAKVSPLLDLLGMPNGEPGFNRVHFWLVGMDLSSLQYAVGKFFPDGASLAGLWRQGGGVWDLSRAFDQQMFVIYDQRRWVVVKRTGLGTLMPNAKPIGPEAINGLNWRGGTVGADSMVSVPEGCYEKWIQGEVSLHELTHAVGTGSGVGWQEVIQMMTALGIRPAEAMDIIQNWRANQS